MYNQELPGGFSARQVGGERMITESVHTTSDKTLLTRAKSYAHRIIRMRESAIFIALLGIMLIITIIAPQFATSGNIYRVSRQISFVAIAAMGVFTVILTGGIDLSLGSIIGISGVISGLAMAAGVHYLISILLGLITGFSVGMINGILVS